jgi:hypothetical protein
MTFVPAKDSSVSKIRREFYGRFKDNGAKEQTQAVAKGYRIAHPR